MNKFDELEDIKQQLSVLEARRTELYKQLEDNSKFRQIVVEMVNATLEDILSFKVDRDIIFDTMKVELFLKKDPHVRYVFTVEHLPKTREVKFKLDFKEDLLKTYYD